MICGKPAISRTLFSGVKLSWCEKALYRTVGCLLGGGRPAAPDLKRQKKHSAPADLGFVKRGSARRVTREAGAVERPVPSRS